MGLIVFVVNKPFILFIYLTSLTRPIATPNNNVARDTMMQANKPYGKL